MRNLLDYGASAVATRGLRPDDELPADVQEQIDAAIRQGFNEERWVRYRPVPEKVVRGMERLRADGHTLNDIADLLRERGKPCPVDDGRAHKYQRQWTAVEVRIVLALAADPSMRARLCGHAHEGARAA